MLNRHRELQLGAAGMWAYGLSVALDYLLRKPYGDPDKITATGHSRDGKAAMLAGAFDERIAVVAPNGSGLGDAASWHVRNPDAESLDHITQSFPHWFTPVLALFAGGKVSWTFPICCGSTRTCFRTLMNGSAGSGRLRLAS